MDRARRAEPYSNATIWTREVARNLAGHLARISNAHSSIDTRSPKATQLPHFTQPRASKRCATSPTKVQQPVSVLAKSIEDENAISSREEVSVTKNNTGNQPLEQDDPSTEPTRTNETLNGIRSNRHLAHIDPLPGKPRVSQTANTRSRTSLDRVSSSGSGQPTLLAPASDSMYDCPPVFGNNKTRSGHDYNKKQAQLKIWQENQAMAKRLRSTKPTLKSKDWERDEKWNQEYLRNQEKRRTALHNELVKVHTLPQTSIVRVRPLDLQSHHSPGVLVHSEKPLDGRTPSTECHASAIVSSVGVKVNEPRRRRSRGTTATVSGDDDAHSRSTASNHRRIMQLRQRKSHSQVLEDSNNHECHQHDGGSDPSHDARVDLNDDEVINVRFTYSRQKSRKGSRSEGGGERRESDMHDGVKVAENLMGLSGALSPGRELEDELDRMETDMMIADQVPAAHVIGPDTFVASHSSSVCSMVDQDGPQHISNAGDPSVGQSRSDSVLERHQDELLGLEMCDPTHDAQVGTGFVPDTEDDAGARLDGRNVDVDSPLIMSSTSVQPAVTSPLSQTSCDATDLSRAHVTDAATIQDASPGDGSIDGVEIGRLQLNPTDVQVTSEAPQDDQVNDDGKTMAHGNPTVCDPSIVDHGETERVCEPMKAVLLTKAADLHDTSSHEEQPVSSETDEPTTSDPDAEQYPDDSAASRHEASFEYEDDLYEPEQTHEAVARCHAVGGNDHSGEEQTDLVTDADEAENGYGSEFDDDNGYRQEEEHIENEYERPESTGNEGSDHNDDYGYDQDEVEYGGEDDEYSREDFTDE